MNEILKSKKKSLKLLTKSGADMNVLELTKDDRTVRITNTALATDLQRILYLKTQVTQRKKKKLTIENVLLWCLM